MNIPFMNLQNSFIQSLIWSSAQLCEIAKKGIVVPSSQASI